MKSNRFGILLLSLLLLLLIYPFLGHFKLTGLTLLLNIFTSLILLSSIYAISDNRRQMAVALAIIIPSLALGWANQFFQVKSVQVVTDILTVSAFAFVAFQILRYALGRGPVDTEKVAAAVCVYLLLGVIWHDLFALAHILIPGSFNSDLLTKSDFIYFSFITLSTLGYGDITPINGPAQALAYTEALVGQLYLTILVARLVGLHIAYTGPECSDDGGA
jgi:hypothetical protein